MLRAAHRTEKIILKSVCRCNYGNDCVCTDEEKVYDSWADEDYLECRCLNYKCECTGEDVREGLRRRRSEEEAS